MARASVFTRFVRLRGRINRYERYDQPDRAVADNCLLYCSADGQHLSVGYAS